jgi:outer membrane receptor protein involved in Fe transport
MPDKDRLSGQRKRQRLQQRVGRVVRVALLWLLVALLGTSRAVAGTTGKIAGKVIDTATGEPLPGANVIVVGTTLGAATDLEGNYIILRVPPGVYSVKASMIGYDVLQYDNVRVSVDKTTQLDFQLRESVVELGETVTVVAERPLIQRDLTSTSATIGSETIENLPVDRFQDVVELQAGVVEGHFRGGRIGEVLYMIDGIPVNDVYSGGNAVEVENNAIAELEVISGTFNAEYGRAMSGVVNIVTKDGGDQLNADASVYVGDYLSTHDDIFWNIQEINPTFSGQGSLSGPVPGVGERLKFFTSGRYWDSDGYIYGRRAFVPSDHSDFSADDPADWRVMSKGQVYPFSDSLARALMTRSEPVPMNASNRATSQLKLTYRLTDKDRISLNILAQRNRARLYVHDFRLDPDGAYRNRSYSYNFNLVWNRVLNPRTFFSLRAARFLTDFDQFVLEDPYDPGYVSSSRLQDAGANAFRTGGMQMWHFYRSTTTNLGKFDLTSQVTNTHQLKGGIEFRRHRLWLQEFEVLPDSPRRISPISAYNHNRYLRRPIEFSAYLQDKMEFDFMIVNAGIRVDYFQPDGGVPVDFLDPQNSPQKDPGTSTQVSPRFGIAYPITDRGVIHVSYGHFFQVPNFEFLYLNPEFNIFPLQSTPSPPPFTLLNTVGNAALKPQKTVIYEIGLQQMLADDIALDVTVYYKDIRNLLGTEVLQTITGIRYGRYINRDYGNVRGITVGLEKRLVSGLGASIDYTFQIAKGNASDPNDVFLNQSANPPIETVKRMVPLDWDRRHQINLTATFGNPGDVALSLIGRLGTGFPYTPTFQNIRTAPENSARRPTVYTVDLYAYKYFRLAGLRTSLYLRVFNLFDRLNELQVFTDTGRAGYSLAEITVGGLRPRGINTLREYFTRPDFYSAPRQIQLGLEIQL